MPLRQQLPRKQYNLLSIIEKTKKFTWVQQAHFKIYITIIRQGLTINKKRHNTQLTNYIWELKGANKDYNLKWEMLCGITNNNKKIQQNK